MLTRHIKKMLLNCLSSIKSKETSSPIHYSRQPTVSGCGPTALVNLLKWGNYEVDEKKHYTLFRDLTNTEDTKPSGEFGCWPHDLDEALKEVCHTLDSLSYKGCLYQPSVDQVLAQCHQGHAIVLHYRHESEHDSHYVFIPSHSDKHKIPVANEFNKSSLTPAYLEKLLARKQINPRKVDLEIDRIYPKAWVVGQ